MRITMATDDRSSPATTATELVLIELKITFDYFILIILRKVRNKYTVSNKFKNYLMLLLFLYIVSKPLS